MLTEMARMNMDDGLVMQFHMVAWRGYNNGIVTCYGSARGESVPQQTDFVKGLKPLLDRFGNEASFRLILYTLDETAYSRELGPLAGLYPSVWLGPPWWFHDSIEGSSGSGSRQPKQPDFTSTPGLSTIRARFFPFRLVMMWQEGSMQRISQTQSQPIG